MIKQIFRDVILTDSLRFLSGLWSYSTGFMSANDVNVENSYIWGNYTGYYYYIEGVYFKNDVTEDDSIDDTDILSFYAEDTYIRISFVQSADITQNLEIRGVGLKI